MYSKNRDVFFMFHKYFIKEIKGCSSCFSWEEMKDTSSLLVYILSKLTLFDMSLVSIEIGCNCLWIQEVKHFRGTSHAYRRRAFHSSNDHWVSVEYPFYVTLSICCCIFFSVTGFLFQNISVCAAAMRQTFQVKILHDTGVTVSKFCSVEIRRLVIRCVYRTRCYWDGVVLICFCFFRPYFCFFLLFPPLSFPSATLSPTITFIYLFCTCCLFSPYVVNECVWPCQAAHFKSPVTVCIIEARLH